MKRRSWIVLGAAGVIVLGVAALLVLDVIHPAVALEVREGRRTWIVRGAEEHRVELPRSVRGDDALVCVIHGPDARVERLVDLYIKPGADPTGGIWIEGKRVENPPEGPPPMRGVFDPGYGGPIYIYCGPHSF